MVSLLFRHILIRLLLLSLLFAAAVASPLHSAMHMQHSEHVSLNAEQPTPDLAHDAGGFCAWCLSPALQTSGWPAPVTHLAMAMLPRQAQLPAAAPVSVYRPSPGRWPFSSRDPPQA